MAHCLPISFTISFTILFRAIHSYAARGRSFVASSISTTVRFRLMITSIYLSNDLRAAGLFF